MREKSARKSREELRRHLQRYSLCRVQQEAVFNVSKYMMRRLGGGRGADYRGHRRADGDDSGGQQDDDEDDDEDHDHDDHDELDVLPPVRARHLLGCLLEVLSLSERDQTAC